MLAHYTKWWLKISDITEKEVYKNKAKDLIHRYGDWKIKMYDNCVSVWKLKKKFIDENYIAGEYDNKMQNVL